MRMSLRFRNTNAAKKPAAPCASAVTSGADTKKKTGVAHRRKRAAAKKTRKRTHAITTKTANVSKDSKDQAAPKRRVRKAVTMTAASTRSVRVKMVPERYGWAAAEGV
ncbi:hypothetical protein EDC01DRAFT_629268 [Geopyxis carbonaria]|nr:hypothetical protein EDC01DRAFT_629268 [Geopyxis carbonaria]